MCQSLWTLACARVTGACLRAVLVEFRVTSYGFVMVKQPCVYILASDRNGTLYIGVTSDLPKRVWEHRNDVVPGFTKRYAVHRLVHFEAHETMEAAITREKQLKFWKRAWKVRLIEENNPNWADLFDTLT